jgi:PAS domain-containing protein
MGIVRKLPKMSDQREGSTQDTIEFVERLKRQWVETIDALPDPFMIVGDDYTIRKANAAMASVAGKPVKTIIGSTCHKLFAGRNKPCENCHMNANKSTSAPSTYEIFNEQNERCSSSLKTVSTTKSIFTFTCLKEPFLKMVRRRAFVWQRR